MDKVQKHDSLKDCIFFKLNVTEAIPSQVCIHHIDITVCRKLKIIWLGETKLMCQLPGY
jgi:hypothetical protein